MLLPGILKGKSVLPAVAEEQGPLGQQSEPQNVLKAFAEDKAAAVCRLIVVKILSVPIVFMKVFYVLAKIRVGMTSALKVCINMDYLTPKGCLIISTSNSSKAMAPESKFKKAELILPREWKECCFVRKCVEEFSNDIAEHLQEYLQQPLGTADQYRCWRRSCEFGAKDPRKLITHVNFHSYHTKPKFIGSQLWALCHDLPACLQNSRSWHQFPKTSEEFVCHWENCDVTFNNPVWFYQHVASHAYATEEETVTDQKRAVTGKYQMVPELRRCVFKGKHKLWVHLRTHTQERVVACPACGGMFSNNAKIFDHAKRQLSEDKQIFVCRNCQKHFANERLLQDHMRGHVNGVTCALCDTVCTSVSPLKAHTRPRHRDECPFYGHLVDSGFKNAYDLHKHVETHNDSDAYSCDVEGCGFTSWTLQTLRQHYKRVHVSSGVPKYKCHICQKSFSWSYTLTLRLQKAHKLSSRSRFRYKEDDEGHMGLNVALHGFRSGS
ncbi:LOW QUALITY PROTEIN: histone H4 transcription factor-like [Leptosomus discolor]